MHATDARCPPRAIVYGLAAQLEALGGGGMGLLACRQDLSPSAIETVQRVTTLGMPVVPASCDAWVALIDAQRAYWNGRTKLGAMAGLHAIQRSYLGYLRSPA